MKSTVNVTKVTKSQFCEKYLEEINNSICFLNEYKKCIEKIIEEDNCIKCPFGDFMNDPENLVRRRKNSIHPKEVSDQFIKSVISEIISLENNTVKKNQLLPYVGVTNSFVELVTNLGCINFPQDMFKGYDYSLDKDSTSVLVISGCTSEDIEELRKWLKTKSIVSM